MACNITEGATIDDGSCEYSCYDNGDYSLSFDGDDWVELTDIDLPNNFTLSASLFNNNYNNYFPIIHKYPSYALMGHNAGYIYTHPPYGVSSSSTFVFWLFRGSLF